MNGPTRVWPASVQPCSATLAFGDAMTCAISAPAEVDTITFSAQVGDVVLLRVGIAADNLTPLARILAPGGNKLCEAGDPYAQGVEISRCAITQSGTHTITIGDYRATRVGSYTLYLQRMSAPVGATTLAPGQTQTATIPVAAVAQSYRLEASAGAIALLRVGVTAGDLTPSVRIFDRTGVALCTAADLYAQGVEISRCLLPQTGSYTVLVGDYRATRTGSYNLFLQMLTAPTAATSLQWGETRPGTIASAAQASTWTVQAAANDVVLVRVGVTAGDLTPSVRIFSPDGTVLCTAADLYAQGVEIARCLLPQAGSYTVLVGDYRATRTGSYNLFLQRLTNPVAATPLVIASTTSAAINAAAEADTYTIPARANDVFLLRTGFTSGNATPALAVFDPDGVKICGVGELYARGAEATRCIAPRAGTYTIIVGDYRALRTGSYNLYVQRLTQMEGGVALAAGDSVNETIAAAAEANSYTWLAGVNDRIQLRMAVTGGELRPLLRVFDPDGIKVCEAGAPYSASTEIASFLLPRSGPYTILATDTTATRSGSYRLSLTCLATPCGSGQRVSIDETGGEASLGELRIRNPAGAFTEPISLTLASLSTTDSPSAGTASVLRRFLVQARNRSGLMVQKAQLPLTYEIAVNASEMSARGIDPAQLRIALWESGSSTWAEQATTWDATRGVVSTSSTSLQSVALTGSAPSATQNVVYLSLVRR